MLEVFPYVLLIASAVANVIFIAWIRMLYGDIKYDRGWLQKYRDMLFGENNMTVLKKEIETTKGYAQQAMQLAGETNRKIPEPPRIMS
jgi:hypothetical protein